MSDLKNKLTKIELFSIEIPLVHPFQTSFGKETNKQAILVKITDENENVGWGETTVSTNPSYCYETVGTASHIQKDFLLPKLKEYLSQYDEPSISQIKKYWEPVRGHEFAKGGIEAALWDLKAEQENKSLGELYGSEKEKIPTGVSIGIQPEVDYLVERVGKFLNLGYQRIKIKIQPGWDVEPIKAIRKEFGDIKLMVDANSAYSLKEKHLSILKELDQYNLMMIEQPLAYNDLFDHKKLQSQLQTPVCLDESIHNPHDAKIALELECCKIINIKPGRVGGYSNAIEIAKIGGKGKVWCGGMLETGIGRIHNLFLQARNEFIIPGDTSGSDRYFKNDIIENKIVVDEDGFISLPHGKGLGNSVLEYELGNYIKNLYGFSLV